MTQQAVRFDHETLRPVLGDVLYEPACRKHPDWLRGKPQPPEGIKCPDCEREALLAKLREDEHEAEIASSQSAYELDPVASQNRQAMVPLHAKHPPMARGIESRFEKAERRRRRLDYLRAERRAEMDELTAIIESTPKASGYQPPPTKDGGWHDPPQVSPEARKKHAAKVRAAKARLHHLQVTPIVVEDEDEQVLDLRRRSTAAALAGGEEATST